MAEVIELAPGEIAPEDSVFENATVEVPAGLVGKEYDEALADAVRWADQNGVHAIYIQRVDDAKGT